MIHIPALSARQRTLAFLIALLPVASGPLAQRDLAPLILVAGVTCLLAGLLRVCTARAGHEACLGRFVSPNVSRLIRRRGMAAVAADVECEISVVCADIRNFTRFSSAVGSAEVMQFLREYYDAVGAVVREFGGTVKDYAGDGILVLVGAPEHLPDHADRALDMAVAIRTAANEVTARWSRQGLPLGIGAGVASGRVTLGVVGGSERLEYAAVGEAVNLAARLCSKAQTSEILIDQRTRELVREPQRTAAARKRKALTLKGFGTPVANFCV